MTDKDALWELTYDFAREAGICDRSAKWHAEEPCETCQGLVNYARRAAALLEGLEPECICDGGEQGEGLVSIPHEPHCPCCRTDPSAEKEQG